MIFTPRIEGVARIHASATEFLAGFRQRVEAGLLSGRPHSRSNYRVTHAASDALHVSAMDWRTAFNVGLNEIEIRTPETGQVQYSIRYPRWATYAVGLGATIAVAMIAVLLAIDLRAYIESHPEAVLPGLSTDQQVIVAWAMVVFWGFVWPWLLIALHKRPVRRLFARIISEVDVAAAEHGR